MSDRSDSAKVRTLLLASTLLPSAVQLSAAAQRRGMKTQFLDQSHCTADGPRTFYGGSDRATEYARQYELCLIEPPLDLITKVPNSLVCRRTQFGSLGSFSRLQGSYFVKPADPIFRCFDAGVYRRIAEVRGRRPIDPTTPVLISEPVDWTSEYRCFVQEGELKTWSPYLSFGRPIWKSGASGNPPPSLIAFVRRLVDQIRDELPPAYVVDIGGRSLGRRGIQSGLVLRPSRSRRRGGPAGDRACGDVESAGRSRPAMVACVMAEPWRGHTAALAKPHAAGWQMKRRVGPLSYHGRRAHG